MVGKFMVLVALTTCGCIDAGRDRAELDLEVGTATARGAIVKTSDGLGHVRSIEPGAIEIWSQAPIYTVDLDPGDTTAWTLTFRNALPDVNLALPDGTIVACQTVDFPTKRQCDLTLTAPTTLRLVVDDNTLEAPLKFLLFADVQKAIDTVQELFALMATEPNARFALMSGDLTDTGTPDQLTLFQTKMELLPFPVYATLGNHEISAGEGTFRHYFGRGNYSFEFAGRRFTMLDSASATLPPLVQTWLDGWLKAGDNQFHVVAMHIPPFDPIGGRNAGFASRSEGRALVSKFAKYHVDLTLYGHVHSYHEYENAGIPSYISGGGGASDERLDGIERHFVVFDLPGPPTTNGSLLTAREESVFSSHLVRLD